MRLSLSGLRPRLMLLIAAAVAPLVGLSFYWASEEKQAEERMIHESSDRLVGILSAQLEGANSGARDILVALSHSPQLVSGSRADCEALLSSLPNHYPRLFAFGMAGLDGAVLCRSSSFDVRVNVSDRTYFRLALESLDFAVGDFVIGRAIPKPAIAFGYPLLGSDRRARAVLFCSLDVEWLDKLVRGLSLPARAEAIVTDRHGTILERYPDREEWVGRSSLEWEVGRKLLSRPGESWEGVGVDGIARRFSFTRIDIGSGPAMYVAVGLSEETEYAKVNRRLGARLLAIGAVLILALGVSWFLSARFVLRPVNALVLAAGRLADGNLGARAGLPHGEGELDKLAAHFDRMAGTLEKRDAEKRAAAEELEDRVLERTAMLQAANEELDAFAYSVSHDLRAPLRAMEGFALALLEDYADRLDDTGRDFAGRIVKASERMDTLIQGLLEYSRLGRKDITLLPIDLQSAVLEAMSLLEADLLGAEAQVTVAEGMPQVMGDRTVVVQVVMNLLSNAIKFVAPGERPQVRVWTTAGIGASRANGDALAPSEAEDRPAVVRLYVEDNGIGIAPQYHERIFRVFERLHGEEAYAGTGIGLAFARKASERMSGRVGVESEAGRGSRFWVELTEA